MAAAIIMDWERCPDGVELASEPVPEIGGIFGISVSRRRTNRGAAFLSLPESARFMVRHELAAETSSPLVMKFINAAADDELEAFFGEVGLPELGNTHDLASARQKQEAMRASVAAWKANQRLGVASINSAIQAGAGRAEYLYLPLTVGEKSAANY